MELYSLSPKIAELQLDTVNILRVVSEETVFASEFVQKFMKNSVPSLC